MLKVLKMIEKGTLMFFCCKKCIVKS